MRFPRFLATALPNRRPTTMPIRVSSVGDKQNMTLNKEVWHLLPSRFTRSKSSFFLRNSSDERVCASLIRDCEAAAAFPASTSQNLSAIFSAHPFPETMVALPLKIRWLSECHRHNRNPRVKKNSEIYCRFLFSLVSNWGIISYKKSLFRKLGSRRQRRINYGCANIQSHRK